jgi:predicted amidohydrolase YtcJ
MDTESMSGVDLLVHGGTIHTVADGDVDGVLVQAGRVLAVGDVGELAHRFGRPRDTFDLEGGTLTPAFVDAHNHYSHAALGRARAVQCWGAPLGDVANVDELLRRLQADRDSGWLLGFGLTDEQMGRLPSLPELDEAVPGRPVFLMHWTLHEAVVNSMALDMAGIGRSTADPQGGKIIRDERGEATGHLVESAIAVVERLAWSDVDAEVLLEAAPGRLAWGIASLGDTSTSPRAEMAYVDAAGRLPLEIGMLFVGKDGILAPPLDRLEGPGAGPRRDHVHATHLKLWLDGARTEFVYEHGMGGTFHRRYAMYSDGDLMEILQRAARIGLPVAMHAITMPATEQALTAIEAVLRAYPQSDPSYRIEHATCLTDDQIRRMASLGVWAVIQPQLLQLAGLPLQNVNGETARLWFRYRDMLDAGVRLAGSSDYPCFFALARYESPLFGMETAVQRNTLLGTTYGADQALTPEEYLRIATVGAAGALGMDDRLGSIEPGKDATLVVLSHDPLGPGLDWEGLRVERTMVRGEWLYEGESIAEA